jgi:hypothetical protein
MNAVLLTSPLAETKMFSVTTTIHQETQILHVLVRDVIITLTFAALMLLILAQTKQSSAEQDTMLTDMLVLNAVLLDV